MNLTKADQLELYKWMVKTRMVENTISDLFAQGQIRERQHSSLGQEAIGVGACYGLRKEDQVIPSLRTRGAFLVKGVSLKKIMAGLFGKLHGTGKGKNTSHHLGDPSCGIIAGSGVLGGSVPVAVGAGLAAKMKGEDWIALVFYGDGAANRGDVHEALNMAAIYKLPVIFIVENNQYAWSFPFSKHTGAAKISDRAIGYGMPGYTIDGNDVLVVHETVAQAVVRARQGEGPTMIECVTYRMAGHSERDAITNYRTEEEKEAWAKRCPIKRLEEKLLSEGILTPEMVDQIQEAFKAEIEAAVKFGQEDEEPEVEETLRDVYTSIGRDKN